MAARLIKGGKAWVESQFDLDQPFLAESFRVLSGSKAGTTAVVYLPFGGALPIVGFVLPALPTPAMRQLPMRRVVQLPGNCELRLGVTELTHKPGHVTGKGRDKRIADSAPCAIRETGVLCERRPPSCLRPME